MPSAEPPSHAVVKTLLLTDLVDSTRMLEALGDERAAEVSHRHDVLARELLERFHGREIDKSDGFLFLFDRPIDAVAYSLAYHRGLRRLARDIDAPLAARAGIHLGEVYTRQATPAEIARGAKPLDVEGLAKPIAARIMSLAGSGQTLLTRAAFEIARRAAHGTELESDETAWLRHGEFRLKGVDEPLEVFEVGEIGHAPLAPPHHAAKARATAQISSAGERRQLTLVHGHVSAYASLEEHLGPEATEALLDRLHQQSNRICASHGGLLHQFSGEDIVLAFGLTETHEDDAVRAVRAAIELRDYVRRLGTETEKQSERPLRLRAGIVTGLVVARRGSADGQTYRISGDPVRRATTLASHAADDEILLAPESCRLVAPVFDCEPASPIELGADNEPLVPSRLRGESDTRDRLDAAAKEGLSTYSGRDQELRDLSERLQEAIEGRGRFVTIEGEAGAGKSRLLQELLRQVRNSSDTRSLQILIGRCQSHGVNIPYLPFVEVLRSTLTVATDGSDFEASTAVQRLRTINPQLEDYLPLYLHLLSIGDADHPLPQHLEGRHFHHAMLEALAGLLTLYTERSPVLLLLEDWHWADDASREVLRQIAEMAFAHPMLVAVTYRPEAEIDWGSPENHDRVHLGSLDRAACKNIMKSVLGVDDVPQSLSERVHERSGGNAFFIEELCRALIEEGRVEIEGSSAVIENHGSKLDLPETVQAVLRSRIDRLDQSQREALRHAAVVGREVSMPLLERILPPTIDSHEVFERLKAEGLMQPLRLVPEMIIRFRHSLTQEVAYDSILVHQRRSIHDQIGEAIEELYPERIEERLDQLAYHFSEAEQWERAVHYARRAATRDSLRSQFAAAARALEEARTWIRRMPDSPDRDRTLVEVLFELERACETVSETQRQQEIVDELRQLLATGEDAAGQARVELRQGELLTLLRHFDRAEAALFRSLDLSRSARDRSAERESLRGLGFLRWQEDRDQESLEYGEQALAVARELDDAEAQARDLINLATVLRNMERHDRAIQCLDEALELCGRADAAQTESEVRYIMGTVHRDLGRTGDALLHFAAAQEIAETQHDLTSLFYIRSAMANLSLELGDAEKCVELYRRSIDASRKARYQHGLSRSLFGLGDVLAALGRPDEAEKCFEEAAAVFASIQDQANEVKVWSRLARLHEEQSDLDGASKIWAKTLELAPLGEPNCILVALEGTARTSRAAGDDAEHTAAAYSAAIDVARNLGNRAKEADLLNTLGIVEWGRGRYAGALEAYELALDIFRQLGDEIHEGLMLNSIGATLRKLDRTKEARRRLEDAVLKNAATGQRLLEGHALAALADLDFEDEDFKTARLRYRASLDLRRELDDHHGEAWMLYHLARTELALGDETVGRERLARAGRAARGYNDVALQAACSELERRADAQIHH